MVRIRARNAWLGAAALAGLILGSHAVEPRSRSASRHTLSSWTEAEESRPVACIKGQFPFRAFSAPATAEQAADGAGAALRQVLAGSMSVPNLPQSGWRRLAATSGTVEFGHGDPPVLDGYVVVHLDGGHWRYEQSGGACIVRPFVDDGVVASWKLDPSAESPSPSSTSLQVLVNDSQCAGGRSPEGRLHEPQVRVLSDAIVVTFIAARLDGFQTCPSHPAVHRTIRLPEPLGDRQLLDGATVPARPPCPRLGVDDCAL